MKFRRGNNMLESCPITLTDASIAHLSDILSGEDMSDLRLRVYVSGGGCSGLQYGMALDTELDPDDSVFEYSGIPIVLSALDVKYLNGAEVDYIINNMGGGFKVNNPNAVKSCGCGSSFSVEDDLEGRTLTGGCGSCSR